jgi:hypothetical protein
MNLDDGKGAKLAIEVIDAVEAALQRRRLPLYKWVFTVVGRLLMC